MLIKKVISAAAAVMAAGALAFSVFGKGIGTAGVYSADVYWDVQFWGGAADAEGNMNIASVTNAEITGDGVYTASIEFAYPLSYGQYFALGTSFKGEGEGKDSYFADYPDAKISILSVKADGVEIKGSPVPDVNAESSMRVYIYNPWADDNLNYADDLDWTQGVTEIEVTFEITGLDKKAETTVQTELPVKESESEITTVTTAETTVQTELPVKESESEITTVTTAETTIQTELPVKESESEVTTITTAETTIQTELPVKESESVFTTVTTAVQTETTIKENESIAVTESDAETDEDTEETSANKREDSSKTPEADENTDSADTGNCSANVFYAMMTVSAAAAVLSKRKE